MTTTSTSTTSTTTSTTVASTTTSSTTTSSTTTTTVGVYIGAYVNGLGNTPNFESMIGRNLAVNMWYIDWNTSFPAADCNTVRSYGGAPHIVWEPWLNTTNTLDAIADGAYDPYITSFATAAKNWGYPVFLRFAHEMNGNWYPWDGSHNGGAAGAAKYIAAWRHIHGIFDSVGASNVRFVWSPNCDSYPADAWNNAVNYYPGNDYVDWIAFDGYNFGGADWKTFDTLFGTIYASFEAYYGKPLMIGEFASDENGGSKSAWITDAFSKIKSSYPKIRMFNWFNINKERDWRIESSVNSQNAFKNAVQDSYFLDSKPN